MPEQEPKSIPQVVSELKELTVDYAKQETIDPIRGLGRFVAFGVGGSLVLAIGLSLLGLAGLRAMQSETGTAFTGNWSWAPYGILFVALLLGGAVTWKARGVRRDRRDRRDSR